MLPANPSLMFFLQQSPDLDELSANPDYLQKFTELDDVDIWSAIKQWQHHPDPVLSTLSQRILARRLFGIRLSNEPFPGQTIRYLQGRIQEEMDVSDGALDYFLIHGDISNAAYVSEGQKINIITKEGKIFDIAQASDLPNIKAMSKIVRKHYLCWPKDINLRGSSILLS